MPLTFPPPTAARDDLDGLLLLGGQPTVENPVAYPNFKRATHPKFNGLRTFARQNKGRTLRHGLCHLMQQVSYRSCGSPTDY